MTTVSKCERCGAPLAADGPTGHCPACLLGLALGEVLEDNSGRRRSETPPRPLEGVSSRFFGDYELLGEIARGGMGIVYRARQLSLNRPVALKMILDGPLASHGFIERFQIEAEAAAKLNHPNIVPIYEIGEHEGRHFFSMKLLEGGNLNERIAGFALQPGNANAPTEQARDGLIQKQKAIASLMAKVARAVHHAHERGVLHRDIKPGNILFDAEGEPHVTDFGLAKLVEEDSFLTQSGTMLGTPAYMAPEQAVSKPTQVTTAADIYSLGAVLYHLLTGRPPFQAPTVLETMRQVVEQPPVPPTRVNPRVDRDLATICLKCLEKEPRSRYTSARALAQDLEFWQNGDTILARPATRTEQFSRWCRRKPAQAGLTGAVLLLLLVMALVSTIAAFRIERSRTKAVAAEMRATDKLWESYVLQARAQRWSGRPGRRFESLAAIRNAAAIRRSLELRNEAIASLALADIRPITGAPQTHQSTERLLIDWPRERYVITATDGSLSFRRMKDDSELLHLPATGNGVDFCGGFTRDGRWLSMLYLDGFTRVWDLESGSNQPHYTCPGEATFSPDGSHLAIFNSGSSAVILDMNGSAPEKVLALPQPLRPGRWNPNGKALATFAGKVALVLDTNTGGIIVRFALTNDIFDVAWHPDGVRLVAACDDHLIHVFNTLTAQELAPFAGHLGAVTAVAFNPAGTVLASDSWDGRLRLWDFGTGKEMVNMPAGSEGIEFSPDGRFLAVYGYSHSRVSLFEVAVHPDAVELGTEGPSRNRGDVLMFAANGQWLATSLDNALTLWEPQTGQRLARLENREASKILMLGTNGGFFSAFPEGLYRIAGGALSEPGARDAFERFVPMVPEALQASYPREFSSGFNEQRTQRSGVSRDGKIVAVAFRERGYVFDLAGGALQAITGRQPLMKFVAVSPDGARVATGGWNVRNVKIWNAATGAAERELDTEMSPNVEFSPDGQWLVSGTGREYIFWNTRDWAPARRIARPPEEGLPGPICFSQDGKILALAKTRGIVHLLSPTTGETIAQIEPTPDNEIVSLAFSPDASMLALVRVGAPPQVWQLRHIRQQLAELGLDW